MLTDLPEDIQKEIISYLDASSLRFFSQTNRRNFIFSHTQAIKFKQKLFRPPYMGLATLADFSLFYTSKAIYFSGTKPIAEYSPSDGYANIFTISDKPPGIIKQLAVFASHMLVLTDQGLYICGSNKNGELGLGHKNFVKGFTPIVKPPGVIKQLATSFHNLALTDQGLYVWGQNHQGQLGLGYVNDYNNCEPLTLVKELPGNIEQIAIGSCHTLVLTDKGLFACGDNTYGQLGLGHRNLCNTFTLVNHPFGKINKIEAIDNSNVIYTSQGIFVCGYSGHGHFGLNHTNQSLTFVPLGTPPGNIQQVAIGGYHSLVLTDQGLFAAGCNRKGQLGLGHTTDVHIFTPLKKPPGIIYQLIVGYNNSYIVTDQGVYVCGENRRGQLGLGHTNECKTFTLLKTIPIEFKQNQIWNRQIDSIIKLGELIGSNDLNTESKNISNNLLPK